jgi:hypothetical protein
MLVKMLLKLCVTGSSAQLHNLNSVLCVFYCCADVAKANSNSEELERLRKQLKQEQLLKMQAVNKLAEIMNRKDMSNTGRKNKVSSADLRKREKECRKLQQELTQV